MAPQHTVIKGSQWVQPAFPVKAETVLLSAIDNQCAHVYPCAFWFLPENKDQKDLMFHYKHLRRAMERIFYQQPMLSGVIREDDRGNFNVVIPPAPGAGTHFYYQDVTNDPTFPSMQQIAAAKYPIIDGNLDGFSRLRPDPFPESNDGDPVVTCQVTKLRGGLVLFGSVTHLLGDLLQPRVALAGWAEQTKLVAEAEAAGLPEPPLPERFAPELYDRTPLTPSKEQTMTYREAQTVCDEWGTIFVLDPTDPLGAAERLKEAFPMSHLRPSEEQNENYLRAHIGGMWKISLESIKLLQHLASKHTDKKLSAVEVITSFLWQRFYMAKYAVLFGKDADPGRPNVPAIIFPGDIRQRLNPPLPLFYLGAAVDVFKATLFQDELIPKGNNAEELGRSVAAAGLQIRSAQTQFIPDRYLQLCKMSFATPHHAAYLPKGPIDFLMTDHTRNVDLRKADWGPGLGVTPEYRQPYFGREMPPGEVTLMPRLENGDIEMMITAERVVLERLCADAVFNRFLDTIFITYNAKETLGQQDSLGSPSVPRL